MKISDLKCIECKEGIDTMLFHKLAILEDNEIYIACDKCERLYKVELEISALYMRRLPELTAGIEEWIRLK